jgi:transposase
MEFRELSDFEWEVIKPLLPPRFRVGRPRADDRIVLKRYTLRPHHRLQVDGYAYNVWFV